jgi:hypothetical protein
MVPDLTEEEQPSSLEQEPNSAHPEKAEGLSEPKEASHDPGQGFRSPSAAAQGSPQTIPDPHAWRSQPDEPDEIDLPQPQESNPKAKTSWRLANPCGSRRDSD